jgi:hypothetical protein
MNQIYAEVKNLENQQKQLKHELYKICWFMRGGIPLEDAYFLSYEDREIIGTIVKENMDVTKKTGLPFF